MKKYVAGVLTGIILMWSTLAFAATNETISVIFDYAKLVVNGAMTDTSTMLYDGRIYIQLRGVSEVFDAGLEWDNESKTAYLTTADYVEEEKAPVAAAQSFRHIVIFDFKEGLSDEEKDTLFNKMKTDLEGLPNVIDGITEMNVVKDSRNPGINEEGQLVINSLFESEEAYMAYASNPTHLEIAAYIGSDIVQNRRAGDYLEPEITKLANKFRHIVIFDFKDGLNATEKTTLFNKMKTDLEALVGVIPGLLQMDVERDQYNTDGNGQIVINSLFEDEAAYEVYANDPRHLEVAAYIASDIVQNRRAADFND